MIPKFRGRSTVEDDKGKWVYGHLLIDDNRALIINGIIKANDEYVSLEDWCDIDIKTIGQSTGLKDKNGVEIFEGDLLSLDGGMPHIVKFGQWIYEEDLGYKIRNIGFYIDSSYDNTEWFQAIDYENTPIKFEVVGNIWDGGDLIDN
ncbi:YopX family protein [Streptococcus intermedius]|uniref:YopX family protein n=1 Tax=Streptococcus intermedius TaxID=1338 RepID=UPI000E3B71D5|nr:YopX family protein [Streptococcus intermedius]